MLRFRITLGCIFLVILAPTLYLLYRSYTYLRAEADFSQKEHAFLLHQMMNQKLYSDLAVEEKRSYSDYRFIRAVQVIGGEEVTLSELAHFPIKSHYAGIVGHFQMEPDGSIRTPVLPDGLLEKIPVEDRAGRERVRDEIRQVLENVNLEEQTSLRRVTAYPQVYRLNRDSISKVGHQSASLTALLNKRLFEPRFETPSEKEAIVFDVESEDLVRFHHYRPHTDSISDAAMFHVEIEPFQVTVTPQYLIYHRNVWRNQQRFVQGYVVKLAPYLKSLVSKEMGLKGALRIGFGRGKTSFVSFGVKQTDGRVLLNQSFQYPFHELNVIVSSSRIAATPGGGLIISLGIVMILVLGGGLLGVYQITATQMNSSAKRQDFISAVSHELKTPLTAIRMYAELLQNQWIVKEEKRNHYYQMIASETERLTRLIQNVLNISNLDRRRWPIHLEPLNPRVFLTEFIQKYGPSVEKAGFKLVTNLDSCEEEIYLDRDALFQMLMNLMDNALKFSKDCEKKMIEIGLETSSSDYCLYVRDYGPGISPAEQERVLQEFYRVENEMTRKTSGAGIGLSLVQKFSQLLHIRLQMRNMHPGLRVELHLPSPEPL